VVEIFRRGQPVVEGFRDLCGMISAAFVYIEKLAKIAEEIKRK
jgi:hypothetical protein